MSERIQKETNDRKEKHIGHQLFVAALAALLAFSILGVVLMNLSDDGGDQGDDINLNGAVGDAAMDEEVRQRWTTYLEYAPTMDLEEFQASLDSTGLALAQHYPRLAKYRDKK